MTPSCVLPATTPTPVAASVAAAEVAVVVVHYRGLEDTLACIASVRQHAAAAAILVIDNGSPDGSGSDLARRFAGDAGVLVLPTGRNLGFGGGCNRGIDAAVASMPRLRHVLLLNPDARLCPGTLEGLLATAARHPDAGIVGCRIVDEQGRLWFGNGRVPRWTLSRFHQPPPNAREHVTGFVTGAVMLLDAALLRDGLRFDERYFLYGEDADLCLRVQRLGRSLWLVQTATAIHRGGGSHRDGRVLGDMTGAQLYWLSRAKVLLAFAHLRWWERTSFAVVAVVLKPLVGWLRFRQVAFLRPYFRGLRDGWRDRR